MTKLHVAISALGVALVAGSPAIASDYSFQTINNASDPTFNQLLGINNSGNIVGYFGAGSAAHPNKGYSVAPTYKQGNFTNENFPNSVQTQVVGINNSASPTTVGFYVDANGNNFGFVSKGNIFASVQDPNTPAATPFNQLLGINDNNVAAGFYTDGNGNSQGYLYNLGSQTFSPITDPSGVATTATGVNNAGIVSGFYLDAAGNNHGFLDINGVYKSFDDPNGTNTMFLGLNNKGQVVGSYLDAAGMTDGLVFDIATNTWKTVDDPNNSANAAFDVTGTTINGINDNGQLVGFYSDGTNVNGFLASPTPEPASIALISLGLVAAGVIRKRVKS